MIAFGSNWLFNTEHPMFFSQKEIQKVGVWKPKIFFFFRGGPAGAEGQAPRAFAALSSNRTSLKEKTH